MPVQWKPKGNNTCRQHPCASILSNSQITDLFAQQAIKVCGKDCFPGRTRSRVTCPQLLRTIQRKDLRPRVVNEKAWPMCRRPFLIMMHILIRSNSTSCVARWEDAAETHVRVWERAHELLAAAVGSVALEDLAAAEKGYRHH